MKKKRSLPLIPLLLFALLTSLIACRQNGDLPARSSDADATESGAVTEEPGEPIAIVKNGKSDYAIVFPESQVSSPALMTAVTDLKVKFRSLTGVKIDAVSEKYAEAELAGKKLIILGNTDYDETWLISQQLSRTTCDEFIIDSVDDSIVILSTYGSALSDAINYFIDHLEPNYDAATKTLLFQPYHNVGEVPLPTAFDTSKIAVYSIVYAAEPPGLEDVAKTLQSDVKNIMGVEVPVYSDVKCAEAPFEILIGKTNRLLSESSYGKNSYIMEYEMVVQGGQLQMTVGGAFSAAKCVDRFRSRFLLHPGTFTDGPYEYTDLATYSQEMTPGADVRVMSSNVLAYQWGEKTQSNIRPAVQRCEIFAGILLTYQPDVIGVQETDSPWDAPLTYYMNVMKECDGISYSRLLQKVTTNGKTVINFSHIIYRSDKYTVDDSGCKKFAANYQTSYLQRVGTWAKFTSISDPALQLILVNSHWAHESEEAVQSCVDEEAALVDQLKKTYPGVTVFCTADYNSHKYEGTFFNEFVKKINGEVASDLAREKGVLMVPGGCRGKINEGTPRPIDSHFIDHIVCTGGYYDVLRHDTVVNKNYSDIMTDHQPIYADIVLKQPSA